MQNNRCGLTVVELTVAMVIATLIVVGLVPLLSHTFTVAGVNITTTKQVASMQQAINIINNDLMITKSFLDRSYAEPTSRTPVHSGGTWRFELPSQSKSTLILQLPATTKAYQDPARELVYNKNSGACDGDAQPLFINIVYYMDGSTLYRRTVLPPATVAVPCDGQIIAQVQSCRSGCAQKDIVVLENVKTDGFKVEYFANPKDTTPDTAVWSTGGTGALKERLSAKVTLKTSEMVNGSANDYELSTRESLVW